MGLETIAILGLSLLQAHGAISQSEDEAQAVIDRANIDAENKSKETRLRAARQQVSFLNSGLTLEGTPMSAIQSTFSTGIKDIDQITTNANKHAKNIISSGRMQALSHLASGISGSFGGGNIFGASNTGGFGNFGHDIFGTSLSTGGGGQIVGGGLFGSPSVPIPGRKP